MSRRHGTALAILVVVLSVWTAAMGWTLARAERPEGVLVAGFAWGTPADRALGAVIDAGGVVVAATWLPSAWLVRGGDTGFAQRLRAAGAWWIAPAAPFQIAAVGGCGVSPWSPSLARRGHGTD